MKRGAVVDVDDAVGEGFGGEEFEAEGAMARLNKEDGFADEDGALQPQGERCRASRQKIAGTPTNRGKARRYEGKTDRKEAKSKTKFKKRVGQAPPLRQAIAARTRV
jgi:hypothetical protein